MKVIKRRSLFSIITVIIICTFLCQNIVWAYGVPSNVSPRSELNKPKFKAVATGLQKVLGVMHTIIKLTPKGVEEIDIETESTLRASVHELNKTFKKGFSDQDVEFPDVKSEHYQKNIQIAYYPRLRRFYLYSKEPHEGKSVLYRISDLTAHTSPGDPITNDQINPFAKSDKIGQLVLEIFTVTEDIREALRHKTENYTEVIITDEEPDDDASSGVKRAPMGETVQRIALLAILAIVNPGLYGCTFDPTGENAPPVADAGADQEINEGDRVILDGSLSHDPNPSDEVTYQWTQITGLTVIIHDDDKAEAWFDAPAVDEDTLLEFELTVTDSYDEETSSRVTVVVRNVPPIPNNVPVADAGLDQTVNGRAKVTLDGSASFDPDPMDKLTYQWTQTDGPKVEINNAGQAVATFTAPELDEDTDLTFSLSLFDGISEVTDEVTVTVLRVNISPVAVAGLDQAVNEGTEVTLDGSESFDPDPMGELTYRWIQTAGPDVEIIGTSLSVATFIAPQVHEDTDLTFSLTVFDGREGHTDEVTITVLHINRPPVAVAGVADDTVDGGTEVTLDGNRSSDPDPLDELTYEWTQIGGDPAVVINNADRPVATFTAPELDEDTDLTFRLTVSDGPEVDTDEVTVTVLRVNIPPVAIAQVEEDTVDEGARVTLDGSESFDPDPMGELTYRWTRTAGPEAEIIDSDQPVATFIAPEVHEDTEFTFSLTVSDGRAEHTADVTVTVRHINRLPVAVAEVEEDTVDERAEVTLDGRGSSDPDLLDELTFLWTQIAGPEVEIIDSDLPVATFTAPEVHEDTELTFRLTVSDGIVEDTADVTVTIRYVNIPPVAVAEVDEDSVDEGTEVTLDGRGSSDLDLLDELTYVWTRIAGPEVEIIGSDLPVATFTAPEVHEDTELTFRLTVSDGRVEDTADVTVTIRHINRPPVAVAQADDTVDEDAEVTLDGSRSFDPDLLDDLTYLWIQTGGPAVVINNADRSVATFTAPRVAVDTLLTFSLTVSDGSVDATDNIEVLVLSDTLIEVVPAIPDDGDDPVSLLWDDSQFNIDGNRHLYADPVLAIGFVRDNNAAYTYDANTWSWRLTEEDSDTLLDVDGDGFTYTYNGRNHNIRLTVQEGELIRNITLSPEIDGVIDYTRSYRVTITAERIRELAALVGIDSPAITAIRIDNLEPDEEFIMNGFQKQYTVIATPGAVTPDMIGPEWVSLTTGGAEVNPVETPDGINIGFTMTSGDGDRSARISVPTRSGGLPVSEARAAWKMDEADLGRDSGPNGNTLTNVNRVRSAPGRPGFGNAAEFIPRDETHFMIPPEEQTGLHIPGDMTVACWIYQKSNDTANDIIARYPEADPTSMDYFFYIESGNGKLKLWNGSSYAESDGSVPVDSWHHIAFTRSGDNVTFYIDGEPSGTSVLPADRAVEDATVFVGKHGISAYADVLLDELGVYGEAFPQEQIQAIMNQVDSSDFTDPARAVFDLGVRGTNPFMLRLVDDNGDEQTVFILGSDPADWRRIAIDILDSVAMNPLLDIGDVRFVEPVVLDEFLPPPDGEEFDGTIEIQGLVGIPGGTRGEYAYDPDLNDEEREILRSNLQNAATADLPPIEDHPVVGIISWDAILTPDGLNFKPADHTFSAFHTSGGTIYIPAPDKIMEKVHIGEPAKSRLREALNKRNSIILHHEVHEIKGRDHRQAVLSEFEDDINGLNYADIVTILLSVLINNKITALDRNFHNLFISALLAQGMPLSYGTYSEILRQTLGIEIEDKLYDAIIGACGGLVRSYIGDKPVDTEGISAADSLTEKVKDEPGYEAFAEAITEQPQRGTILIALDRFFVKNDTLSDAVAIDTEYFQRFIHFARNLNQNITLAGITSRPETDISTIQLIALIRRNLPGEHQSKFKTYHKVDFTNYHTRLVQEGIDIQTAVTILSEESAAKIAGIEAGEKREHHKNLKLIAPFGSGYNRAATVWQEFRIAAEGIGKEKSEFLSDIIAIARGLLDDLVERNQIDQQTADRLIEELDENLIWYIPVYFDPRQYYLSIEQMKVLLTNA